MSDHSIVRSVVLVLGLGSSFKMTGQKVFRKPFRKESPNQFRNTRKTVEKLRFLVWKTEKCLALLVFSETALKQQKIIASLALTCAWAVLFFLCLDKH